VTLKRSQMRPVVISAAAFDAVAAPAYLVFCRMSLRQDDRPALVPVT
jgi:hypothetical protein